MSIGSGVRPRPEADYAAARVRFERLQALDGATILPQGRSRLYDHGARTPLAVVLLHGLTNCPQQWHDFASDLHARGHTVVVPRLPGHADSDRSGRALAHVRADDFLATASDAVDIAAGAGESVVVAGLSIGGAFATWLALERDDVARAVAIVPMFGLKRTNAALGFLLAVALRIAPNFYIAWDARQVPPYAYLRFPTHALAACLRVGVAAYRLARLQAPLGRLIMLLNALEPAIDNGMARSVARRCDRRRPGCARIVVLNDLPANHDIIDPTNPFAHTALVYPHLRHLLAD